jgi:integrase
VNDDLMPVDPDLDDLPAELRQRDGPFTVSAVDSDTGELFDAERGPYHLRHTFATEALAAGVSIFELSRLMGASVKTVDKHYGHLARDPEDAIRAGLESRSKRSGIDQASADEAD